MFKKLLKYDMQAVWRIWWILAVGIFGLSVAASFVFRFFVSTIENENFIWLAIFAMVFLVVSVIAIIASIVITPLLVYYQFYKHFFSDEGYLTFTLPVSRRDLLLSKTLNALIWQTAHILLLGVCVLFFALFGVPAVEGEGFINVAALQGIGDFLAGAWDQLGIWFPVYVLEGIVICAGWYVFSTGLIYFCITVGSVVAKKYKLLAAIGIYYLVNMAVNLVLQIFGTFGLVAFAEGFGYKMEEIGQGAGMPALALALLVACLIVASGAMIMMFMTIGKLERKLNLS